MPNPFALSPLYHLIDEADEWHQQLTALLDRATEWVGELHEHAELGPSLERSLCESLLLLLEIQQEVWAHSMHLRTEGNTQSEMALQHHQVRDVVKHTLRRYDDFINDYAADHA